MMSFDRTDRSELSLWWWTVDRWSLTAVVLLMGFGAVLMLAASPAAGGRIGLDSFQLASRQLLFLPIALLALIGASLLAPKWVRRAAVIGLLGSLLLCTATLVVGTEIKGASRWITIAGFSLQPSEFLKPCFVVVTAWLFTVGQGELDRRGVIAAVALWLLAGLILLLQPDFGQFVLLTTVWSFQFFLAGLPLPWVAVLAGIGGVLLIGAYLLLPHVAERINSFFDPTKGDQYQINRSLEAFAEGGLFGRGPGEGTVKAHLPDSHSDFIFAVAGEEFGLIACLLILALFAFVVLRGFRLAFQSHHLFAAIATAGLLAQFGLQALINMGSTLHLVPTKGMTLPFISYGGSSLIAVAVTMGMMLALTRRNSTTGLVG